jgi:hypothetical protein
MENEKQPITDPTVLKIKEKYDKYKSITERKATDNLWLAGLKLFLHGLVILLLILLSPFAIIAIIFSLILAG